MTNLTHNEKKILLLIFKDFKHYYNSNYISKIIGISRVGAMKIFKKLLKENIVYAEKIGKSINYKLNLNDDYVRKLMTFLLADEATNHSRWKNEFKEIFKKERIVILFGSIIRNYEAARDIDLMIILNKEEEKDVNKILKEKEKILPKKLHAIKLTFDEFLDGIRGKNKATTDIIKNSVILYGQDKYVEIIKNVSGI